MFDPSKLNLDLDENNKQETQKDSSIESGETQSTLEQKPSDVSQSEEVKDSMSETLENESVLTEETQEPQQEDTTTSVQESGDVSQTEQSQDVLWEMNDQIHNTQEKQKDQETQSTQETKEEISEENLWKTEYERSIMKTQASDSESEEESAEKKIIYDINITNVDIILLLLVDKKYDYVTFEPNDAYVTITFVKDKAVAEKRYIKYPVYSNILLKAKALTNLTIEETENTQEGSGEKVIRNSSYKVIGKVVPGETGAKLFLKVEKQKKKSNQKAAKKTSMSQIFTFLGVIAFIALVVWWAFITFVIMNAKTVEDVKFFAGLGINLNDINTFVSQAIAVIFSILIFIETVFLVVYIFKAFLTKKEFKQKRTKYTIIAILTLLVAFSTGTAWMFIDQKIRSLPNWQEMAQWDVILYDNAKLNDENFGLNGSLITDTSNLIGPLKIEFNVRWFKTREEQSGFTINKFIWDFGDDNIFETPNESITYEFTQKGIYPIGLTVEEINLQGEVIQKTVENIPNINIANVVDIIEKPLNNGGKLVDFDASDLKDLWKIEWYFLEDLETPAWTGDIFRIWKPIFEDTIVWMYIRRSDKTSETLDKIFIITGGQESNLDGEIVYERGIIDDLEFDLKVDNINNDFWDGIIEEFKWIIGDKEITKQWDVTDLSESSTIKYTFDAYGEHTIKVILTNSAGEEKELSVTIDIPKRLKLSKTLKILNDWEELDEKEINYEETLNEYYINEIWVPTTLTFDARFIRANNLLYTLKKVSWDYNSDGDIDESERTGTYDVNTEGNHAITVYYEFEHRKIADDKITLKEQIFIEWLRKEAIINFDIKTDSYYVPVVVWFDASKSQVKNENIEKFIWDYGDGVSEERDALVQWHRYTTPWDYEIKLKVVTSTWKEYTTSRKLILKPKPQSVKIISSMKKAPVWQWIDFSSEESEWQISGYFWDFGDGKISTQANPTHYYTKPGKYNVTLKLDFTNKNVLEDTLEIEIYED